MLTHVLAAVPMADGPDPHPAQPPGTQNIDTVLNWISWGVLAACIAGFLFSVAAMAWGAHHGREMEGMKGLAFSLIGCVLVGAVGGITAALT